MTVAVVIPCYNAERWILNTIKSVLTQPTPAAQIIVVDDGSTDASRQIIEGFGDHVTLVTQTNAGGSAARNAGLALVTAEYVTFLDADDYQEGDFIGGAERALRRDGADVAFSLFVQELPDGQRVVMRKHAPPHVCGSELFSYWFTRYWQSPCSIVWRTGFTRRIGGWDESVVVNDDGEFAMRGALYNPVVTSFSEGQGVYRTHEAVSVSKLKSETTMHRLLEVTLSLIERGKTSGYNLNYDGFAGALYGIAHEAFEIGADDVGRRALAASRNLGMRGHRGGNVHKLASTLLGLELKTSIANRVRRWRGIPSRRTESTVALTLDNQEFDSK